jgi:hypothetical protein
MVFIKTNLKRKCTKRRYTKRQYSKRKSNKCGGKFTTNPNNEALKARIIKYLQNATTEIGSCDASDIVGVLEDSPYEYDLNYVLQQFKDGIKKSNDNYRTYPRVNAIYDALTAMLKEAEEKHKKEQQAKATQKEEPQKEESNEPSVETQKEDSNEGCPSLDKEPVDCVVKKDYLRQALIFHPDKNPTCVSEATRKFQELQSKPTCKFTDEAVK